MTTVIQCIADRGLIHSSIDVLCKKVGISKTFFYSFFSSKEELVLHALRYQQPKLLDYARSLMKNPKSDVSVLLVTFFLTVIFDLTIAIEIGLLIAMLFFMRRVAETTHVSVTTDEIDLSDEGEIHHDEEVLSLPKGVEVYEIDGPFFFGVANKFDGIMKSMGDKPKVRIIRMRKVSFIDSTGLHNLESLFRLSEAEHIHMILSGVNEHVHRVLTKSGFDKKIGAENICSNINEAVEKAKAAVQD